MDFNSFYDLTTVTAVWLPSANKLFINVFCLWYINMTSHYFQQDSAPAHRAGNTIELLRRTTPDSVAPDVWPPNSPDLNLVDYALWSVIQWWHRWAATASTAWVVQLGAVAHWWCSWSMPNTLACLCSCQRRTLWTYFVTINLFSLYLMNFMLHTMLDTVGYVLRVHMKCDV